MPRRHQHDHGEPGQHGHEHEHPYNHQHPSDIEAEYHNNYKSEAEGSGGYYQKPRHQHGCPAEPDTPTVTLYPFGGTIATGYFTSDQDHITGDLTPANFTEAVVEVERVAGLSTVPGLSEGVEVSLDAVYDSFHREPGLLVRQTFQTEATDASTRFTFVGSVSDPISFSAEGHTRLTSSSVLVAHGTHKPHGFFWKGATGYDVVVGEPQNCTYAGRTPSTIGRKGGVVTGVESQAPYSGSAIKLFTEAILGKPSEESGLSLACENLPVTRKPLGFQRAKQPVPQAMLAGKKSEHMYAATLDRWHLDSFGSHRHDNYYDDSAHDPHHADQAKGYPDMLNHQPEPHIPSVQLRLSVINNVAFNLQSPDINATGYLTPDDLEGVYLLLTSVVQLLDSNNRGPALSRDYTQVGPAEFYLEGPLSKPKSLSVKTKVVLRVGGMSTPVPTLWPDVNAYEILVAQPTTCFYVWSPGPNQGGEVYDGIAKVTKSPVAYKGTFVDLMLDAFAPRPAGEQEYEVKCTFPGN